MQAMTGTGSGDHPAGGPCDACRTGISGVGELGHGFGAILRRYRPAPIADGRAEGSHAGEFELICFDCGDNPGLDYSQVSPRLQRIRGPRTMETAWTAYERHLGLARLTDKPWMRATPWISAEAAGSERARAHSAPTYARPAGEHEADG